MSLRLPRHSKRDHLTPFISSLRVFHDLFTEFSCESNGEFSSSVKGSSRAAFYAWEIGSPCY